MPLRQLGRYLPRPLKQRLVRAWVGVEKCQMAWASRAARVHPAPIFVLGNQKAGTSAIAVLLAEATGLSVSMDLQREALSRRQSYPRVRRGELPFASLVAYNRLSFSRDIVKEANLTVFYDELVAYFPRAKFVFVLRDPRDNIRSILNSLDIPGNLSELPRQKKLRRGWDLVLDGTWFGLPGAHYIDRLALRWNFMADQYLRHGDTMVLTRYEVFLADKVREIGRLAVALGHPPLYDITAKIDIPYQPPGNRAISWEAFFGEENLCRIERTCGASMQRLGYALSGGCVKTSEG